MGAGGGGEPGTSICGQVEKALGLCRRTHTEPIPTMLYVHNGY